MKRALFTDMDWTILNSWICDRGTKETLDFLISNEVEVILSTWKGLPRIDNSFCSEWYEHKILENWSRVVYPWWEQLLQLIEGRNLLVLWEIFEKIKDKISFLFFYPADMYAKSWIFYIKDTSHNKLQKFKGIMSMENTFELSEFIWYLLTWWKIPMLNVCIKASSLEELWLTSNYGWLQLVFNEWMLNISLSDKWEWIVKILSRYPEEIEQILVAWNDLNDIPAFNKAFEIANSSPSIKTWIIVVGDLVPGNKLINNWKTLSYRVSSPEKISHPIRNYFNL